MTKLGNVVGVVNTRLDSWYNALTGIGNSLRDKMMSTQFLKGNKLSDDQLETLYHEEDMAARICDAMPEEALRKGYYLTVEGEEDSEIPGKMREYEKGLGFPKALEDCAVWSRVFGGAAIYVGVEDGQEDEALPVKKERIKSIKFLQVLDKRSLTIDRYYSDPLKDKKFGQPETYRLNSSAAKGPQEASIIHESRLIRIDGARTSDTRKAANGGWCESSLQKVHEVLMQFNVGWQGTAHVLQDASQAVFKIEGLINMIASGDKESLQTRMELVDMSRSVVRAIVLDAERESFERQSYSFAGIPDVLRLFILRLAAAARMPVTVLMGQSPSGLNATGDSDIRLWYDSVQAYQASKLANAIAQFYELVFLSQDFDEELPEKWEVKFERLWQMTDKEQAELEKAVSDKDKTYIDTGVLLPEEVSLNRFKAKGFSMDTQIDMAAREEMLEAEIELAKNKAGEEPIPPPLPGKPAVEETEE